MYDMSVCYLAYFLPEIRPLRGYLQFYMDESNIEIYLTLKVFKKNSGIDATAEAEAEAKALTQDCFGWKWKQKQLNQ